MKRNKPIRVNPLNITPFFMIFLTVCFVSGQAQRSKNVKPIADTSFSPGIFTGVLPCAKCQAIIYRLELKEDQTYYERSIFQGGSAKPVEHSGPWIKKSDGLLVLMTDNGEAYFRKHGKGLLMLDPEGKPFAGDQADRYILNRVKELPAPATSGARPDRNLIKWQEGYNYYAWGNNPVWELDMDFDTIFRFRKGEEIQLSVAAVEADEVPSPATGRQVFKSISDKAEMIITLTKEYCVDNSTGETTGYMVSVQVKSFPDTVFRHFEGCGAYVADIRLQNVWTIKKAGDTELTRVDFPDEMPRMEINIKEGRVNGFDGCNSFSGILSVAGNKIIFGDFFGTKMACENMELSTKILGLISGKELEFQFDEKYLRLTDKGAPVLILQNIN
jgi:hypothetical protein